MTTDYQHINRYANGIFEIHSQEELRQRLDPKQTEPGPRMPGGSQITRENLEQRWQILPDLPLESSRDNLVDPQTLANMECYQRNIENFIGTVKVPVGVAGPLLVNGLFAQGSYYVPLATTEAALVASYNRGARLISQAGGCTAMLLNESVSRTPGFAFKNLQEAGQFVVWVTAQIDEFKREAAATTRYGQLINMQVTVEGNFVYLSFEFITGDASGQNMVTIATQNICHYIESHSPIRPRYFFIEANMSGDKKASAQSFLSVRGRKVSAEVLIPAELVRQHLHTDPTRMVEYWRMSAMGGVLSGTMGVQGHYANALAALYIACGQDAACVAESAVGVTRFEIAEQGQLYAAVTLPNLMIGTVGGGTALPSQRACLEILGLSGPGKANALAEVCAAICLAGELSIAGAICSGDFARAHELMARGKVQP